MLGEVGRDPSEIFVRAQLQVIELCRAEACKARGVEALVPVAEAAAGERVRLKVVYCLGLCATGPNARTGDTLHSRLDEAALRALVQAA